MKKEVDFQKNCFISIAVILLYFLWPTVMNAFWETFGGGTNVSIGMIIYNIIGYLIFVVLLFFAYWKSLKQEWNIFWKEKKNSIFCILKYTVFLFISIILINIILNSLFKVGKIDNEVQLLGQLADNPLFMILMVTIYYPVVESIVFQKTIRQVVHQKWLFIIISSLFFGYFNIAFSEFTIANMIGIIPYMFLNAVLALSYFNKKTIVVPIGIKMLYNLLVAVINIL